MAKRVCKEKHKARLAARLKEAQAAALSRGLTVTLTADGQHLLWKSKKTGRRYRTSAKILG